MGLSTELWCREPELSSATESGVYIRLALLRSDLETALPQRVLMPWSAAPLLESPLSDPFPSITVLQFQGGLTLRCLRSTAGQEAVSVMRTELSDSAGICSCTGGERVPLLVLLELLLRASGLRMTSLFSLCMSRPDAPWIGTKADKGLISAGYEGPLPCFSRSGANPLGTVGMVALRPWLTHT